MGTCPPPGPIGVAPPVAAAPATAQALAEPPQVIIPAVPPPAPRAAVAAVVDPRLGAAVAPQSVAAEQYRALRARVMRAENGRALRALIITSPNTGDGKSLTAANLA